MKKLILILAFVGLIFAQSEIEIPITKEISPQVIAGDTASKITCKYIIVDSEGQDVIVSDVLKYNEETEEYEVYYQDIAFTFVDLPCELTNEEIEALR